MGSTRVRKGQPHKKERFSLKIGAESNETLIYLTQSSGNSKKFIVEFFIDLGHKYGFLDEGWKERLIVSLKKVDEDNSVAEMRAKIRGRCHKLAYGKNKEGHDIFSCIAFNPKGALKVRVLGKTETMMEGKCAACDEDRDIMAGYAERDERIRVLETKIQLKAKTSRKVPVCNKGAILSQEGTAFKSCPKSSIPVSVATYCKVLSGGLPCALYAEIELAEGPK